MLLGNELDFFNNLESIQLKINCTQSVLFPEFAIANVQCQYDSPSDTEEERPSVTQDHTYDTRDEPPAFIIHQVTTPPSPSQSGAPRGPFVEVRPTIMSISPDCMPAVNVIHVGERQSNPQTQPSECSMNKRIRRSEVVLRAAADCVSRGLTFQTVSEQFNIPISTIRFFMARKGILPRRRRGRSAQTTQPQSCGSPEQLSLFNMQHFKLPETIGLRQDDDTTTA